MRLTTRERALLCALAFLQPVIGLSLRMLGIKRTRGALEAIAGIIRRVASPKDAPTPERVADLARIAGRFGPVKTTCLRQSLAVYCLLLSRGLAPKLGWGVRHSKEGVDMHSWISVGGIALDPASQEFVPFKQPDRDPP